MPASSISLAQNPPPKLSSLPKRLWLFVLECDGALADPTFLIWLGLNTRVVDMSWIPLCLYLSGLGRDSESLRLGSIIKVTKNKNNFGACIRLNHWGRKYAWSPSCEGSAGPATPACLSWCCTTTNLPDTSWTQRSGGIRHNVRSSYVGHLPRSPSFLGSTWPGSRSRSYRSFWIWSILLFRSRPCWDFELAQLWICELCRCYSANPNRGLFWGSWENHRLPHKWHSGGVYQHASCRRGCFRLPTPE